MFGDKLKKIVKTKKDEQEGNDKRKVENLVFFVVILIVTIIIINSIWNGNSKTNKQENDISSKQFATRLK